MTLTEWERRFRELYGRRNAVFLDSLDKRLGRLFLAKGDLERGIRENDRNAIERRLASFFAWIFCVVGHFDSRALDLTGRMISKFPAGHCGYCGQSNCGCGPARGPLRRVEPSSGEFIYQADWSLARWCAHFQNIYGANNCTQGIANILLHLGEELGEVLEVKLRGIELEESEITVAEAEEQFALELADVLAWLIGVANFFGIDLEAIVRRYYASACPECSKESCECGRFPVDPGLFRKIGARTIT